MNIFTYLTPITYWILIVLWLFILGFYLKRLRSKEVKGRLLSVLIIILAVDAFRTLFESFYFGAWYTALAGFLPKSVHTFLIRPEMVFIPKIINVIAAIIVIALLIYKWLPNEESEKIAIDKLINKKTKELKKSEQKYQDLYDNAPDMYVSVDAKTSLIIECNQILATKLGYTKNEIIGRPIFEMYHPDSLNQAKKEFQRFVSTGTIDNAELGLKTKNGRKIDVNLNVTSVLDEKGNVLYSRSAWRDITDRKKAEETTSKILESSIGGIYIYNLNLGKNTYVNRQYTALTGYSLTEISSMPKDEFTSLFHPDDQEKVSEHMRVVVEELPDNSNLQIDYRFKSASGGWKWFRSCDAVYERDENGSVQKIIGTFIDITENKRLENELLQAHKMEAIGTLAGGIAHDFNNILSSIIGFSELALEDAEMGISNEDNMQEILFAGIRAKDLVKQILAFARQSDVDFKPIRVTPIAIDALKLIRSSIPTTIDITSDIDCDSLILGDPSQVHQVFMNLCTNAAHAMEESGGVLSIVIQDTLIDNDMNSQDFPPGNYLMIEVSDTGKGIPVEIQDSIFEPYFTTKSVDKGTGMGLAMVHGIVKNHNGKIMVESELGKGACFSIYLPETKMQAELPVDSAVTLARGTERILFVDDENQIVKMGRQTLERLGYKVTTCTSSPEALALFKRKPADFDLVITDMTMPEMTGDKLSIEMMKIRSDIPVILSTGYSKQVTEKSSERIGIKAFSYKPLIKADLAETVRKVLDETRGWDKK